MAAAEEEKADLVLISQDVPGGMAPKQADQYASVAQAAVKVFQETAKPVVVISNSSVGFQPDIKSALDRGGVPLLQGTREGLKAVRALFSYAKFQREMMEKKEKIERLPAAPPNVETYMRPGKVVLSEYTSKKVLAAYGVPCAREVLCKSPEETIQAAGDIGYPVVLKVISPEIPHRTEAGVIALDVGDENTLKIAYKKLIEKTQACHPSATIEGILCQKKIEGAVAEAIIGILMDRDFGPAVLFGLGGIMVEILGDRALGIPPLSRDEAREMIECTKASQLLRGFRGSPRADLDALTETLMRVGWLAIDQASRIKALDVNPLLVLPQGEGVVAVDALLALKDKFNSEEDDS
jgi:acyl-CoA synthetase (NDP forming)